MELSRYQITQDDKEYILSTSLVNGNIRIECQDKNFAHSPTYSRDYSLNDLTSYSEIFTLVSSINEAQNELNKATEDQQIKITNNGQSLLVTFNIQIGEYAQEIVFELLPKQGNINYIIPQQTTKIVEETPLVINNEMYKTTTDLSAYPQTQTGAIVIENNAPDVTYSTKGIPYQTTTMQSAGCGCVLEHDRINKIESNTSLIKSEHEALRQRIKDLNMKIQTIKQMTKDIRAENGALNMKTLDLKKEYNNLIEAEAALRAENDDLRREKHELLLKKNELGFYIVDQHTHDTIREVNIPLDEKRKIPTNVLKKEKHFGGYGSSGTIKDVAYTSGLSGNNAYGSIDNYK